MSTASTNACVQSSWLASSPRLRSISPLTNGVHRPFGVPTTEDACEQMLASGEALVRRDPASDAVIADLARFLGATSRIWTQARRFRLEGMLTEAGTVAIQPVLQQVAGCARDDVLDAAVRVFAGAAARREDVAKLLVELANTSWSGADTHPAVREVLVRAVARATHPVTAEARVRIAFDVARADPSPAVRDVAVQALSLMGAVEGRDILIHLLEKLRLAEKNEMVRQSIDEAIDTLRDV